MKVTEAECATCGNRYERTFQVVMGGRTSTFDCFECAIAALAPKCAHCGCRVIGHGVEQAGIVFCCNSCLRHEMGVATSSHPPL
jgi:hypothetical protein